MDFAICGLIFGPADGPKNGTVKFSFDLWLSCACGPENGTAGPCLDSFLKLFISGPQKRNVLVSMKLSAYGDRTSPLFHRSGVQKTAMAVDLYSVQIAVRARRQKKGSNPTQNYKQNKKHKQTQKPHPKQQTNKQENSNVRLAIAVSGLRVE